MFMRGINDGKFSYTEELLVRGQETLKTLRNGGEVSAEVLKEIKKINAQLFILGSLKLGLGTNEQLRKSSLLSQLNELKSGIDKILSSE